MFSQNQSPTPDVCADISEENSYCTSDEDCDPFEDMENLELCEQPDAGIKSSASRCLEAHTLLSGPEENRLSVISVAETVSNEHSAHKTSNDGPGDILGNPILIPEYMKSRQASPEDLVQCCVALQVNAS